MKAAPARVVSLGILIYLWGHLLFSVGETPDCRPFPVTGVIAAVAMLVAVWMLGYMSRGDE